MNLYQTDPYGIIVGLDTIYNSRILENFVLGIIDFEPCRLNTH